MGCAGRGMPKQSQTVLGGCVAKPGPPLKLPTSRSTLSASVQLPLLCPHLQDHSTHKMTDYVHGVGTTCSRKGPPKVQMLVSVLRSTKIF